MADINTLPYGLLGFLGLKNGGQYPSGLRTDLHPTWDLAMLYASANSRFASGVAAVAAVGANAVFTVPQDETWLVLAMSAGPGTLGAGQELALGLQMTDVGAATTVGLVTTTPDAFAAVGQRVLACLAAPIFAPPGVTLGPYTTRLVAGPINVTCAIRYARFLL